MTHVRRPGALGWVLVAVAAFAGFIAGGSPASAPSPDSPSFGGWLLLYGPAAAAFGFIVAPLLARAMERRSPHAWSTHMWLFSGLGPLAFLAAAFGASVLWQSPEWSWLMNAAFPLGVSLGLIRPDSLTESSDLMESDRNLL